MMRNIKQKQKSLYT